MLLLMTMMLMKTKMRKMIDDSCDASSCRLSVSCRAVVVCSAMYAFKWSYVADKT